MTRPLRPLHHTIIQICRRRLALQQDYGWGDAGWHRPAGYSEVQTPHMDKLVETGVELDRNYVSECVSE